MGTHPSGMNYIEANNTRIKLKEYIGQDLTFLFKILSVAKALSIQSHPDKQLAIHLHNTKPDIYKDPNHKPELAYALTPFAALCGFRPLREIVKFFEEFPVLQQFLDPSKPLSGRFT